MSEYHLGSELKQKNRNNIYRLLHREGCLSKQSITRELGLSLPTVTQNLAELTERGLVREQGSFGNTGGRRAKGYAVAPEARTALGVDLNKRHFALVLLDLEGKVLGQLREYRPFENSEGYYRYVAESIEALLDRTGTDRSRLLGVGLAVQGLISPDRQSVAYGRVLNITGLRRETVAAHIPYPSALFHDSDMAAYAESWIGSRERRAVYLSLSTNLGGALIGPGASEQERFGQARLEHMTLYPGGRRCYCGQRGCADAYCSTSLLTDATEDGRLESFFAALKAGAPKETAVWKSYQQSLAILVNNARVLFDAPVILGGYLAEFLEDRLEDLKEESYPLNSFDPDSDYLELSRVRSEPVAVGAALQYIEAFITSV